MPQTHYVYSTLSCHQKYTSYKKSGDHEQSVIEHSVVVHGGANVADKKLLSTPLGVVTKINDDDFRFLMDESHAAGMAFKQHKDAGHIKVQTVNHDPEKVAADMERADDSAQLTPNDYPDDFEGAKPSSGDKSDKSNNKDIGRRIKKALAAQE